MTGSTLQVNSLGELNNSNVSFDTLGTSGNANPNSTTNLDFRFPDDGYLVGGDLSTNGSTFGDAVTIQVVDVDGVYAPAGTVLGQPVTGARMTNVAGLQLKLAVTYCPTKILGGLYLRVAYTNGSLLGTVNVAVNYIFYKALV